MDKRSMMSTEPDYLKSFLFWESEYSDAEAFRYCREHGMGNDGPMIKRPTNVPGRFCIIESFRPATLDTGFRPK